MLKLFRPRAAFAFLSLVVIADGVSAARDKAPGFDQVSLNLPGVPAAIFPADIDADGIDDLVVVVAYNDWGSVTSFEEATFDDIEGMVEVMNVVPALLDHRELRVYPGQPERRGYGPPLPTLELESSVHAFAVQAAAQGAGDRLLALTDEGISSVHFNATRQMLEFQTLVEQQTAFTGDDRFYADLDFLYDLNHDGLQDALLPVEGGWVVLPATTIGFSAEHAQTIAQPQSTSESSELLPEPSESEALNAEDPELSRSDSEQSDSEPEDSDRADSEEGDEEASSTSRPRLPEVRDLNGDGLQDLVLLDGSHSFDEVETRTAVYCNLGDFRFSAPEMLQVPESLTSASREDEEQDDEDWDSGPRIVYLGDLDGDGQAVAVVRWQIDRWLEPTVRQEIDSAKRPLFGYRLYRLGKDLRLGGQVGEFEAMGYNFEGSHSDQDDDQIDVVLPGDFQDLDGDGRLDLVSVNLDFSILPLITRALLVRSLKLTMDFQVTCQQADGRFQPVSGIDLSGQFKINLRNNKIRHLSQFAGDFNGDGRADFVQLGRGRKVTIHYGQAGCRYPSNEDKTVTFERKPKHLGLVRVLDLDGDQHSDLYVVHPLKKPSKERSTPVRVDLYLSQEPLSDSALNP